MSIASLPSAARPSSSIIHSEALIRLLMDERAPAREQMRT
jgi:hypothetical protein